MAKRGRGLGHVTYFFKFWDSSNISETAEDTNLKFCTLIEGKGPDTKQKKCKTSQKGAWLRLRATSKSGDILNIQATEALKNGKI